MTPAAWVALALEIGKGLFDIIMSGIDAKNQQLKEAYDAGQKFLSAMKDTRREVEKAMDIRDQTFRKLIADRLVDKTVAGDFEAVAKLAENLDPNEKTVLVDILTRVKAPEPAPSPT